MDVKKILVAEGLIVSMSEGRRLLMCDAVEVNGQTVDFENCDVSIGDVVKVGHRGEFRVTEELVEKALDW